jgi:hypothetical protein
MNNILNGQWLDHVLQNRPSLVELAIFLADIISIVNVGNVVKKHTSLKN